MRADTLAEWSAHPSRCRAGVRAGDGGGGFDPFGQALCAERTIARLEEQLAEARAMLANGLGKANPHICIHHWPPRSATLGAYVADLRAALADRLDGGD
jgi:hypothetical protein